MAMNTEKILIVDDSEEIRKQMKWAFTKDYTVQLARDRHEAVTLLKKHRPKVVTLDLGLPRMRTAPRRDSAVWKRS